MSKPVARGARLITVGVALAGMSASLLVVSVNALDSIIIDRAELDDGLLRVEGEGAVPDAIVWVTSAESSASSRADDDGRIRLLAPNFQSSNCQVTVTDGATSAQVSLDECTPTAPPTTPPPTTAPPTTRRPRRQRRRRRRRPRRPSRRRRRTTTTQPPTTTTTTSTTTTTTTTTLPPTTTSTTTTTTVPPTTVPPTPVTFTDLHDLVPRRCFSAPLSTVDVASVRIGIESGHNPANWHEQRLRRGDHRLQPAERGRHVHRHRHGSAGTAHHPRSLPAVREPVPRTESVLVGERHRPVDGQRCQRPVQLHAAEL